MRYWHMLLRALGRGPAVVGKITDREAIVRVAAQARLDRQAARLRILDAQVDAQLGKKKS